MALDAISDRNTLDVGVGGRMLAVFSFGAVGCTAGRYVLSPLLPSIVESLEISPAQAGLALSVMGVLVAASRFPAGRLSDQLTRKTVLVGSLLLAVVGLMVLGTAPTYALFIIGAATLGLGTGAFRPVAFAQLSDLFSARRGQALGIMSASISLAGIFASGLANVSFAVGNWRTAFWFLIAGLLVVTLLMHRWNPNQYALSRVTFDVRGTIARLLKSTGLHGVLIAASLFTFAWHAMIVFLPTFLQIEKGFSPTMASNAFALYFLIGIAVNPIAGTLSDRWGFPIVAAVASGTSAIALAGLILADSQLFILAAVIAIAFGTEGFWAPIVLGVMSYLSAESRGGDFGAVSTVYLALGSLGPAYVGVAAETTSYGLAFVGLIPPFLLTAVVLVGRVRIR